MKWFVTVLVFTALFALVNHQPKPATAAQLNNSGVTVTHQVAKKQLAPTPTPQPQITIASDIPSEVFCASPKQFNMKRPNIANASIGKELAAKYGWTDNQWKALLELWSCESQWNHNSINPDSGAGGIPQSWPASKMATFGGDYATNPTTQIAWGLDYIKRAYGTPQAALAFHYAHNWY